MVEFQLLQRGEHAVPFFHEPEPFLLLGPDGVEAIVGRDRLSQEGCGHEQHRPGGHGDAETDRDPGQARAGARRATSRRCSRASGHNAIADPSRKTKPAIQIRLTSGFTSTFTNTTLVVGLALSAIT